MREMSSCRRYPAKGGYPVEVGSRLREMPSGGRCLVEGGAWLREVPG